jgi:hypothetical protein
MESGRRAGRLFVYIILTIGMVPSSEPVPYAFFIPFVVDFPENQKFTEL